MNSTVTASDGREMTVPDTVTFILNIGKHRNRGYITDELMTVTTPAGWLVGEEIPSQLSRYLSNPSLETKQGDIRKWKIPAGTHIKAEKMRELIEDSDQMEISRYEEEVGNLNQTRIEVEVSTDNLQR